MKIEMELEDRGEDLKGRFSGCERISRYKLNFRMGDLNYTTTSTDSFSDGDIVRFFRDAVEYFNKNADKPSNFEESYGSGVVRFDCTPYADRLKREAVEYFNKKEELYARAHA